MVAGAVDDLGEHARELHRFAVAQVRRDHLDPDGKARGGPTEGRDRGREADHADEPGPADVEHVRMLLAVDRHLAGEEVPALVVRERWHRQHRAQERVVVLEPVGPDPSQPRPFLLRGQPGQVPARGGLGDLRVRADRHRARDQRDEHLLLLIEPDVGMGVLDLRTGIGELVGGAAEQVELLTVDRHVRRLEPDADPVLRDLTLPRRGEVEAPGDGIVDVRTREHPEQQLQVFGTPGDRAEHVDVGVGRPTAHVIEIAALRDDAVARLEPEHPAAVRRVAHRTADVRAHLEGGEPRRHRRCGTARRAARHVLQVPRVVRRTEDLVERLQVARPARHVRLAEHDGTGVLEPRDGRGVVLRHVVGQLDRAAGRTDTTDLDRVLDGDGQAVQRPARLATRGGVVGPVRFGAGPVEVERDHRVDRRVQPLDPVDVEIEQLAAGELAGADARLPVGWRTRWRCSDPQSSLLLGSAARAVSTRSPPAASRD